MNRTTDRSNGDRNQDSYKHKSPHKPNSSSSSVPSTTNSANNSNSSNKDKFNTSMDSESKQPRNSSRESGGSGDHRIKHESKSESSNKREPTTTSAATDDGKKKFTGRCRLFFGNVPMSLSEEEFIDIIKPYGESDDLFLNAKKGFGFVKMETRAAAEACKNGLDGLELQGRSLRVRYATHSAALQVKNLTVHCTNETLMSAFSSFGEVERAVVVVDDKGKSTCTGIVEFSRRGAFTKALETITKGVFLISKSLRPVTVQPLEQKDEEDGLPEKYATRNQEWLEELSVGPRMAEPGSYEYDIGMKWKDLEKLEADRKQAVEDEMAQKRIELELDVEAMIHEHKANQLRQDMLKRQAELNALEQQRRQREEQKLRELEMRRMQMNQQNQQMMGGANPMNNNRNMGGPNNNMGGPNNNMNSRMGNQMSGPNSNQRNMPNQMGDNNQRNLPNQMGGNNQMGGPNQRNMSNQMGGNNQMMGGNQRGGPGFGNREQELLMQQQQALREMQMKQQGGGNSNRPLIPPPTPPGMNQSGRGEQGPGGRRMGGPNMMGGNGPMNQGNMGLLGRGGDAGPMQRNGHFDNGPSPQNMQRSPQMMERQRQQEVMNRMQMQQHNRGFNQGGGMGPDHKRPRRF